MSSSTSPRTKQQPRKQTFNVSGMFTFLGRFFRADSSFFYTQFISVTLFLTVCFVACFLVVFAHHLERRRQSTSEGLAYVEKISSLVTQATLQVRLHLPGTDLNSGAFPGLSQGLRRVRVKAWKELKAGEFFSARIEGFDRKTARTQDNVVVTSNAMGMKAFPHYAQDGLFWFDPSTQNSVFAFSSREEVFIVAFPPAWLGQVLTAEHPALFEKPLPGINIDDVGRSVVALVTNEREILSADILAGKNSFALPLISSDPFILGEQQIKSPDIVNVRKLAPAFLTMGDFRILKYKEGLGAGAVKGTNLTVLYRWIPAGTIALAATDLWLFIGFSILGTLLIIIFVAACAQIFYSPIEEISEALGRFGAGGAFKGYVSLTERNTHVKKLSEAVNITFDRFRQTEANTIAKMRSIELAANMALSASTTLLDKNALKWSWSSQGAYPAFVLRHLGMAQISLGTEGEHSMLAHAFDEKSGSLILLYVAAHRMASTLLTVQLAWQLQRFEERTQHIFEVHQALCKDFLERFPANGALPFWGSSVAIFTAQKELQSEGENAKWNLRTDDPTALRIYLTPLNKEFRQGLQTLMPKREDNKNVTPEKDDGAADIFEVATLSMLKQNAEAQPKTE